jgi:hypothetical protein
MIFEQSPCDPEFRLRYDEEIRLVAKIVEQADRTLRPRPALLIVVGCAGASIDLCYYLYYRRYYELGPQHAPAALQLVAHGLGIALLVGVTGLLLARPSFARWTVVDRQLATTFSVAVAMALLVDNLAWPRWVMAGPSYAMFWNALLAVPMLSIGLQYASRTLVAGGLLLAASVILPRFDLWNIDLYLALGMFFGCALPGMIFGFRRRA